MVMLVIDELDAIRNQAMAIYGSNIVPLNGITAQPL
jgi:hypothetical protein